MNIHTHTHRHFPLPLESEKRLCFKVKNPDTPPDRSDTKKVLDGLSSVPGVAVEWTSYFAAEIAAFLAKTTVSIPIGFLKGLDAAWQNNRASAEVIKKDAVQAASFFRRFPLIGKYFEGMQFKDVESYRNLTDSEKWLNAFNDLTVFEAPVVRLGNKDVITPKDLLLSQGPEERKAIYMNFVDSVIPAHVLGQNGLPVAGQLPSASERFGKMNLEQHKMLNESLKGIFDAAGPNEMRGQALSMARQTLNATYRPELALHDLTLKGLQDDYEDALAGSGFTGLRAARVSSTQLQNSSYAPAMLRAAMKLGVVNDAHLQSLSRGIEKAEFRESSVKGNVRKNLNELTGMVESDRRRDALGVREIFENMSSVEKLILLGGAAWALTSKWGRGLAGAGALLYFGMKFGFKDPDPLKTASGWLNNIITLNGRVPNDAMPGGPTDPRRKVDSMMAFLKEFDPQGYNRLEMQATGFSLMGDMRMSDIAGNMHIVGDPTKESIGISMNIPNMRRGMERIRKENKWKTSIDSFFMDPASMQELGNGVGYVFYKLAAENPANFEVAKQLNDAMRKLPAALSIADLPCVADKFSNPVMHEAALEANRLYMRLVMLGQNVASTDRRSFGDVITSLTRVPQLAPRQRLQENGVAYATRGESQKEGPGADDSGPAGANDTTPDGSDNRDPNGSTEKDPTGAYNGDVKGPSDTLPKGPNDSGPAGANDTTPDGSDNRDPRGATNNDPFGSDDRMSGSADSNTPNGSTDITKGPSDATPPGPNNSLPGADSRTPKGPDDTKNGVDDTPPRGPSDDATPDSNDGTAPGANEGLKNGADSRTPEGSSTPEKESEKTERIKKISEFLVSLDSNKNLIGQDLNIDLGKSKVKVKFSKNRISLEDSQFKLEAEIDLLVNKKFTEAEFHNVKVGRTENGEVGLYIDARVLKQSDPGVIGATDLEAMISKLASGHSYEGTTQSGRKTRIVKAK